MKGLIRALILFSIFYYGCMVGFGQNHAIVDFEADIMRPVKIADSTVLSLVGNVIFHHNGAIITCDSALRYSDRFLECFDNVIINKDSTYVYGDKADFNGLTNIAHVYSPIVKLIDGDVTMYSYDHLEFNTLTNIGRYTQSGTISQNDNLMESVEAIYHANERDVYFVGNVVMRNEEYLIESDSMGYNFDSEITTFYKSAQIWNKDGDYLSADRGNYDRIADVYTFTENSYVLTDNQQMWADSITYMKTAGITYLFNDIQILDEEQNTLLFGDYGVYWVDDQQAILTDNPSVIGYDVDPQGMGRDSSYMRADSIFLFTVPINPILPESASEHPILPGREMLDSVQIGIIEQIMRDSTLRNDSVFMRNFLMEYPEGMGTDSINRMIFLADSLATIGVSPDSLWGLWSSGTLTQADTSQDFSVIMRDNWPLQLPDSVVRSNPTPSDDAPPFIQEIKLPEAGIPQEEEFHKPHSGAIIPDSERSGSTSSDELDQASEIESTGEPNTLKEPASTPLGESHISTLQPTVTEDILHSEEGPKSRKEQRRENKKNGGSKKNNRATASVSRDRELSEQIDDGPDTLTYLGYLEFESDSSALEERNLLEADSTQMDVEVDSIQRIVRGYRNVRIYREDIQAVCDSIVSFSLDSTTHMYYDPVMWSQESQIKSDEMHFYTRDDEIYRAEFDGSPIMIEWVKDSLYNQVAGKLMNAYFVNNEIDHLDVNGNAETFYYMQESGTDEIGGFLVAESAEITFLFDSSKVNQIVYRGTPEYIMFPMDMIPADQQQYMKNFEWLDHRRPKQIEDVFDRIIRPERREESLAIPQPRFVITEQINGDRERLTELGTWRDRNETLGISPDYFNDSPF